jgi:F-type H+-transporting ATPase subunit delta
MRSTKSAIRYAKAILELSSETNAVDQVASDMERIVEAGNDTGDFQVFLNSPVIKTDKKISILKVLFQNLRSLQCLSSN